MQNGIVDSDQRLLISGKRLVISAVELELWKTRVTVFTNQGHFNSNFVLVHLILGPSPRIRRRKINGHFDPRVLGAGRLSVAKNALLK